MTFFFARPRSHYRTGRNAHLLRDDAPIAPTSAPDLSKLIRSTEDALGDAGAIVNDARIVDHNARKRYTHADFPMPGAIIVLRRPTPTGENA